MKGTKKFDSIPTDTETVKYTNITQNMIRVLEKHVVTSLLHCNSNKIKHRRSK